MIMSLVAIRAAGAATRKVRSVPQSAPDPIPIARWTEGPIQRELELVDLVPPYALTGGWWAADLLLRLIQEGKIVRSNAGIQAWIEHGGPTAETSRARRQTMIHHASNLLRGRTLEQAAEAFVEGYQTFLRSPGVQATRIVLHGIYASHHNCRLLRLYPLLAPHILAALDWDEPDGGVAPD
jgi:hypothetical protein